MIKRPERVAGTALPLQGELHNLFVNGLAIRRLRRFKPGKQGSQKGTLPVVHFVQSLRWQYCLNLKTHLGGSEARQPFAGVVAALLELTAFRRKQGCALVLREMLQQIDARNLRDGHHVGESRPVKHLYLGRRD